MKLNFRALTGAAFITALLFSTVGCSSDDKDGPVTPPIKVDRDFQVAYASGSGSQSAVYLQGLNDISKGEISFSGKGYQLPSSRTARIFMSSDGKYVYNLNYTVGDLAKYEYKGGQNYVKIGEIDSSKPLGTKTGRFTKISDELGSVHYITSKPLFTQGDKGDYIRNEMTASIGLFDLNTMSIKPGYQSKIDIRLDEKLEKEGYHIWRIDAPVVSNGKLYYGAGFRKYNAKTGKNESSNYTAVLVFNQNDLTKPKVLFTDKVQGDTNGYRTPTLYKNERGEVLVMVNNKEGNKGQTKVIKIVNDKFDTGSIFDLGLALGGKDVSSNGWFYAANGIGYMPYERLNEQGIQIGVDKDGQPTYSSPWGLARIDLNTNTAVDLNVPKGLWLTQYQTSAVKNGVFYIALAPISGKGNIYMFDIKSTAKDGKVGAAITSGADQYYIGVYF
ncbi:hypothetical protein [Myroides marinus]|uniref:hypothetical protein n=1 Tax=Myroides marinus TaxID=703342 RepID=UPI002576B81F|nr:hypothetical protein [Myroides marinus]MDM1378481.1 hypothetical protein [Myroides marinus]MDM1385752.1 hypothetical protein [Myroides marinus]MDM1392965.1 hypothetical protein [Myroides marinus]